ncbi:hypothetical protein VNO77_41923 [Canavalia gladiata]|uniref:Uncharacterized protein n=1 Tax=Canavalia gladiata TaxID=3824 RepID=A0AAN9K1J5_CANGL
MGEEEETLCTLAASFFWNRLRDLAQLVAKPYPIRSNANCLLHLLRLWGDAWKTLLGLKGPRVQVCKIPSIVACKNYILVELIPTQAVKEPFRLEPHAVHIIFQCASTQRKANVQVWTTQ